MTEYPNASDDEREHSDDQAHQIHGGVLPGLDAHQPGANNDRPRLPKPDQSKARSLSERPDQLRRTAVIFVSRFGNEMATAPRGSHFQERS